MASKGDSIRPKRREDFLPATLDTHKGVKINDAGTEDTKKAFVAFAADSLLFEARTTS